MAWLGESTGEMSELPTVGRCTKDEIEEQLFEQSRDLFSEIDLVFFDTTSIYFEGQGGETIGQHGYSKDHRPDLKQMMVGLAVDIHGWPICSLLWPGNTTDAKSVIPLVQRFQKRFRVKRVSVVADRGMISKELITALESESLGCQYILGGSDAQHQGGGREGVEGPIALDGDPAGTGESQGSVTAEGEGSPGGGAAVCGLPQ